VRSGKLETWFFVCHTNLTQTTTNTAIALGEANGLTARDFAIATVVVAGNPVLPAAGVAPDTKSTPEDFNKIAETFAIFSIFAVMLIKRMI
jgi:hypothetical protein